MNVSDTERVATILEADGFEVTPNQADADVIILNTCSVREKAEQKLYSRIGEIRSSEGVQPKIGVIGCVAQLEGDTLFKGNRGIDFVAGTRAVGRVGGLVREVLDGAERLLDVGEREEEYDWKVSDRQRHSPYVAFLPIIEGCNKFCTYCIVPFSRGRERSLGADVILAQVGKLISAGVKEVHLIGQNVNSYRPSSSNGLEGVKGATPFSKLLRKVALTGIERIKFTTSFPRDFHADIVDAMEEHPNLCNWVHLPVQSGSDAILKSMKRGHTIDRYIDIIDRIRRSPKNISVSTDIIVGFPGETEEDFVQTVELARYCRFDSGYIFKYSPRPGTPAYSMPDDVSAVDKTRRFLELEAVMKASQAESLQALVGSVLSVLVEDVSSRSTMELKGHSACHRVINFEGGQSLLGKIIEVLVTERKSNTLYGRIV